MAAEWQPRCVDVAAAGCNKQTNRNISRGAEGLETAKLVRDGAGEDFQRCVEGICIETVAKETISVAHESILVGRESVLVAHESVSVPHEVAAGLLSCRPTLVHEEHQRKNGK